MSRRRWPHEVLPGGLSAADHERIHALAEQGWKSPRIAREIRKHPSTVQWFMYRAGLAAPAYRRLTPCMRRGRLVAPFGPAEDALVTRLRVEGLGPTEIARRCTAAFGHARSMHTIAVRLTMLAAREDDDAAFAEAAE